MARAVVPGAWRRLWRDRPRVVAVALLALTAVAASGLQSTAALVLRATLDEGWRGPYDILVTQAGKDPVEDGMLRTDATVDASIGRLSLDDLEFIRSLPGVEVAAPIALVSLAPSGQFGPPSVWLPVPVGAGATLEQPEGYRITVSSATTDATGTRDLGERRITALAYVPTSLSVVIDADGNPSLVTVREGEVPALQSPDGSRLGPTGEFDPATGTITLGIAVGPRPATSILLVDPVAERALLGEEGAFLDPLVGYAGAGRTGLLVLEREVAALPVRVTVERLDGLEPGRIPTPTGDGGVLIGSGGVIPPRVPADAVGVVLADYEFDAADLLDPFQGATHLLGGVDAAEVERIDAPGDGSVPRSVLGGDYVPGADGVRLLPRGYAWFGGYSQAPLKETAPHGAVTDYAKLYGTIGTPAFAGGVLDFGEVVGSYRAEDVFAGVIGRAPLGGYETTTPTLDGSPLPASLTGFGVPGTNPVAIGSFAMLDGFRAERPIAAIRIRVAGIDAYTPEAQQRLLQAASALQALGYTATIVAGSSPEPVPVTIADYALADTDDAGRQLLGDLGTIEQPWARLGAVLRVDAAVSATSVALLVSCVVAVGLLLAVVQLARVPARRDTSAVLRRIGWRRRRIMRWFLAEDAIALGVLLAVGAASVLLATVPIVAAATVGFAIVLVVVTALAAAVAGSRAARPSRRRPRAHPAAVHSPERLGLRRARTGIGSSVVLGLAVALIVVSVALAAAAFVQGRELAGPSVLGVAASTRAWLPQGALAALALVAAIVLAVLARRMTLARAREQLAALTAMGWGRAAVAGMQRAELAVTAVPGLLAGLALAVGIAAQLPGLLVPVLTAAAGGGVLAVVVVLLLGRAVD